MEWYYIGQLRIYRLKGTVVCSILEADHLSGTETIKASFGKLPVSFRNQIDQFISVTLMPSVKENLLNILVVYERHFD